MLLITKVSAQLGVEQRSKPRLGFSIQLETLFLAQIRENCGTQHKLLLEIFQPLPNPGSKVISWWRWWILWGCLPIGSPCSLPWGLGDVQFLIRYIILVASSSWSWTIRVKHPKLWLSCALCIIIKGQRVKDVQTALDHFPARFCVTRESLPLSCDLHFYAVWISFLTFKCFPFAIMKWNIHMHTQEELGVTKHALA